MVFHCKMCGANLDISEGMRICKCSYCDSYQTIPDISGDRKLKMFSNANRLRFDCQFDMAAEAYKEITTVFPEEAEAYWGLCLCRYGIEYVDDPETGKKIPTCHRTDFNRIFNTSDYNNAQKYADEMMKVIYSREADYIDSIQQRIISISAGEKPFDIFICYKETDENGKKTEDSFLANYLYNSLTREGFKVFFASVTLKDKLGTEFEPYIFSAINSSQVMICVGTSQEHFNAVWVRNEWSRFLDLMKEDKSRVLIPCYQGITVNMLPNELKGFQAQNLAEEKSNQIILNSVKEIFSVYSDTKNQLKTLFDQYELQVKSQLTKIHTYEDKLHKQAIEEKRNAHKLFKQEYQSIGTPIFLCIMIAFMVSMFLSKFLSSAFPTFGNSSIFPLFSFVAWCVTFIVSMMITMPKFTLNNKIAQEKLARRLAYDETAPDYQSAMKNVDYEYAMKMYKKEYISPLKITLLFVLHIIITFSVYGIVYSFFDLFGYNFSGGLIFSLLFFVPPIFYGLLIAKQNKKAKKNLEERLMDSKRKK